MQELIEQITKALVDNPDEVSVSPIEESRTPFWNYGLRRATSKRS